MKNDHSRNDANQNNHHRYNKIYSSGDHEVDDMAGNYLAKTSEKINSKAKPKKVNKDTVKISYLNQNNFKNILMKNSTASRGRSNNSGPLSNQNSIGENGTPNSGTAGKTMKIKKNLNQKIKFDKKKINFVRSTSQNPKRSRSLSNNAKFSNSKHSDESGNTQEVGNDETSSGGATMKINKNEVPQNWRNNASNNEKIAALQSISLFRTTGKFNPGDFQKSNASRVASGNQNSGQHSDINYRGHQKAMYDANNPVSPVSTKGSCENEAGQPTLNTFSDSKPSQNILSKTMKSGEKIMNKNSGTMEASSYNSLLSHQSKSFSNTKNEKSMNSIINSKTIITKKSKDSSGVSLHSQIKLSYIYSLKARVSLKSRI